MKLFKKRRHKRIYIVPTQFGFLYGVITLVFLFLAADFGGRSFIPVCAFLITIGLVAMYLTHSNLDSLEVLGATLENGFAGETALLYLKVQNHSSSPLFSIQMRDQLLDVAARQESSTLQKVTCWVPLEKRGRLVVKDLKLSTIYPLGLFYAWRYYDANVDTVVYPAKISGWTLPEMQPQIDLALDRGEDGLAHRMARPTDPETRLDWKVLARLNLLMTKIFEDAERSAVLLKLPSRGDDPRARDSLEQELSKLCSAMVALFERKIPYRLIINAEKSEREFFVFQDLASYHASLQALALYEDGGLN